MLKTNYFEIFRFSNFSGKLPKMFWKNFHKLIFQKFYIPALENVTIFTFKRGFKKGHVNMFSVNKFSYKGHT